MLECTVSREDEVTLLPAATAPYARLGSESLCLRTLSITFHQCPASDAKPIEQKPV